MSDYLEALRSATGFERIYAYISWANERDGYYTPDELINLSLKHSFQMDNPLIRVRKGTCILENAVIKNSTVIDGKNVTIGEGTVLDQARIVGSNVEFGKGNLISGSILVDNLTAGDFNKIKDIQGKSPKGQIKIGSFNIIENLIVNNDWENSIAIGNHNQLHPGLTLNNPFPLGFVFIGNHNDLGNGGGAVITSSFRYARGWGGPVIIGSNVELTRGAEIGGLSLVGWDLDALEGMGYPQTRLISLFTQEPPETVLDFLQKVSQSSPPQNTDLKKVGLYGVVKMKRCGVIGYARLRDDVRVHGSFLRNLQIRERCKIFFSAICSSTTTINLDVNDRAVENQLIYEEVPWENYPTNLANDDYLPADYEFYKSIEHANMASRS